MAIGPIWLRQKIIDDVEGAGSKQAERVMEMIEFSGPGIGEDQIKLPACEFTQKARAIINREGDARIIAEMAARQRGVFLVAIDGQQRGGGIHSIEEPGGRDTGSGAEFE